MCLLCNYKGALRAPIKVYGEIHTAEAAAEAAAAAPAAAASLYQAFQVDTKGLSLTSLLLSTQRRVASPFFCITPFAFNLEACY